MAVSLMEFATADVSMLKEKQRVLEELPEIRLSHFIIGQGLFAVGKLLEIIWLHCATFSRNKMGGGGEFPLIDRVRAGHQQRHVPFARHTLKTH
jgi:hypothetical protein